MFVTEINEVKHTKVRFWIKKREYDLPDEEDWTALQNRLRVSLQVLADAILTPDVSEAFALRALLEADIVFCTLTTAGNSICRQCFTLQDGPGGGGGRSLDVLIVDEAAQASEADLLVPLALQPHHLILIGDPCQLPAFVQSAEAQRLGYGLSAMQRYMS